MNSPETFMGLRPVNDWNGTMWSVRLDPATMYCSASRPRTGRSSGRLNTQLLCSDRESLSLFLHCGCELRRPSRICDLAGHAQFFAEVRLLNDVAYISSDTLAKCPQT